MATAVLKPSADAIERVRVSYEEYLARASETRIAEWVDGEMITHMPPLVQHQNIGGFLFYLLSTASTAMKLGKVILAPCEVKLWSDGPAREPDIFFISNEKLNQLGRKRFEGAPDLVVEIVSSSSVREDKVRKFGEYERAGVSEYWIIDPRPHHETADFFQRDELGIYQPVEADAEGVYRSRIIPHFWLDVEWLWQQPLPDKQLAAAEVLKDNPALAPQLRELYTGLYNYLSRAQ